MERLIKLKDKEIANNIASITEKMTCQRGFECLRNGFENLSRLSNFTGGDFPECKEREECQFKSDLGLLYLCRCPLRMYMFSRIKMARDAGMASLPSEQADNTATYVTQPDR